MWMVYVLFFIPGFKTQKTFLQLQTLIRLVCVCATWTLSAWDWGIPVAQRSLEEEPMMASSRRPLAVWHLVSESCSKLAATVEHAVIVHLQSEVGRDISALRLYACKWFWWWFTSRNCPLVPLVGWFASASSAWTAVTSVDLMWFAIAGYPKVHWPIT